MAEEALFTHYADAFVELAKEEKKVKEVREEIKTLTLILKDNRAFLDVITDVNYDLLDRYKIIDETFKGVSLLTLNFTKVIIKNDRGFYLYNIFKETLRKLNKLLNIVEGSLYLTEDISDEDLQKLEDAIGKDLNKKVELYKYIDSTLIGGFVVEIEDSYYDSSIKTKLENLKTDLLKGRR